MNESRDSSLQILQKQGADIIKQAQALEITNQEDYDVAYAFRRASKALVEQNTAIFEDDRANTYKAYKGIMAKITKYTEMPKKADGILKRKMEAWNYEQDRFRRFEITKLKETAKDQGMDETLVVVPEVPKHVGESFRTEWRFEVIDITKVPYEYLMLNDQKVGAEAKAKKEKTNIPGIRVFPYKIQVIR